MASFVHADTRIGEDGKVTCKACGGHLGSVFREEDPCDLPWWAEHPDGECAGFGPEKTRREAVRLLTAHHECRGDLDPREEEPEQHTLWGGEHLWSRPC